MDTPSEKFQKTLVTLRKFFRKNKYLPATREIAEILGYGAKSKTQVLRMLGKLVEFGYLDKTNVGKYVPGQNFFSYELFHGVKAGNPTGVFTDNDLLDLESYIVDSPDNTFFITVSGGSMQDAGILNGDIIAVQKSPTAKVGDIIVADIDGDFTVKYYKKDDMGEPYLQPANDDYFPIRFSDHSQVKLVGRVTGVIRKI